MKHFFGVLTCACVLFYCAAPGRAQEEPSQSPPPGPPAPKTPQPPPLPPRPKDVMMPDEGKISIGIMGWFPMGQPFFDKGKTVGSTAESLVELQGKPKLGPELILSLPGGGHNAIRLSYFDTKAAGNLTTLNDVNLWSIGFVAGEYLSTHYRLQGGKFSYEFVTWPYPLGSRRFRLKTLWQVQYAKIDTTFFDPIAIAQANAAIAANDTTATISGQTAVAQGSKTLILPTLGIGITDYLSQNVHFDLNASGFAIPHHSALGDADGSISFRFSKLELQVGAKLYYFKTSPQKDFYLKGRLSGAFAGLRFYLD